MTALLRYEAARDALTAAVQFDEVLNIKNVAEQATLYARLANDTDLIEKATEIKVRAERKAGEMLTQAKAAGDLHKAGNPQLSSTSTIGLADIGITRDQSSRFQQLAAMPQEHFETAVAMAKATAGQVTTSFMLREAKKAAAPRAAPAKPAPSAERAKKSVMNAREVAQQQVADDAHSGFDPLVALEAANAEIETLHAQLDAASADDLKGEAIRWRRAQQVAEKRQSQIMDESANARKHTDFLASQLKRCGRAVGETDPDKIAPTVEAFVRKHARKAA